MPTIPSARQVIFVVSYFFLSLHAGYAAVADDQDRLYVGVQPDGRIVVPTNQILNPAGKQITFPGRPVDLAFAEDGRVVIAKNLRDLVIMDVTSAKIKQILPMPLPPKK